MGTLGWQEITLLFLLALLLFGPKKLPELGRTLGKALTEFRRASSDLKATFDRELSGLEREGQSIREIVSSSVNPPDYSYNYDYSYDSHYDGGSSTPSSESTATEPSTVGASATQGAEPKSITAPEGTVATSVSAAAEVAAPHPTEPVGGSTPAAS
jgi:TatA/E family protein of Tat protein translocase